MATALLYKPPTRVTTISIPLLAIVNRADPGRERLKHRDDERFDFSSGKVFLEDPYKRGSFAIPVTRKSVNYSGGTFAQGDLTAFGLDFVYVTSTNSSPGTVTTRTGAQMFADIAGAYPNMDWNIRINNIGEGSDLILAPGQGVALFGQPHIPNGTYSDIRAIFTDSQDVIMTVWTANNPYNASPH
jgi:hypothetical protein